MVQVLKFEQLCSSNSLFLLLSFEQEMCLCLSIDGPALNCGTVPFGIRSGTGVDGLVKLGVHYITRV